MNQLKNVDQDLVDLMRNKNFGYKFRNIENFKFVDNLFDINGYYIIGYLQHENIYIYVEKDRVQKCLVVDTESNCNIRELDIEDKQLVINHLGNNDDFDPYTWSSVSVSLAIFLLVWYYVGFFGIMVYYLLCFIAFVIIGLQHL